MTRTLRTVASTAASCALLTLVALGAVMLGPALLGFERYVILTGSMSGTYDAGSVVFAQPRPASSLRVGDVITYAPPAGETSTELVTHRIVTIGRDESGNRVFRTKGDANQAADPWRFELAKSTQPVVRFHVPHVGRAITALAVREIRMGVIGVPALLIAASVLVGLFRDAGRARPATA